MADEDGPTDSRAVPGDTCTPFIDLTNSHSNDSQSSNSNNKEPPQMHSVQPASFITQILESAGTDFIEPVEILRFLHKNIVLGRDLEVTFLDCLAEGETNFIAVDRENILQTTFIELKYVTNPRFTLQVDFITGAVP